jgi:hypothetical protein
MSGNTTTTTTPKKKKGASNSSTVNQIETILKKEQGAGFQMGGTSGGTSVPGVTTKLAGDIVPFTAPHQLPWFNPPSGTLATTSSGATQVSYSNFVDFIHQIKDNPTLLERIQRALKQQGLLPSTWANYGNLDTATTSAWERLGQSAIGGVSPVTSLLNSGMSEGSLETVLKSIQSRINSAQSAADAASSVNVSLMDPNEVAQHYATAMESMGLGAPTQQQVQQFTNAFIYGPQGEIAAAQNQSEVQKKNMLAGAGDLTSALNQATLGNVSGATAAENMTGPTYVATKSMPNIDAEAIAAAQNSNPAQYYATASTYLYGLLQRMLDGDMSVPTSPQSPTSLTPAGGIVTNPIAGAP